MIKAIIFDFFGVLAGSHFLPGYLNTELYEYIRKELKPHYKIGLLSNTSRETVSSKPFEGDAFALFDAVVLSAEVYLAKPDPDIFVLACERLDVDPSEAVFIDDSEYNLTGATAIGMQTILFEDIESFKAGLKRVLALE